MAGRRKDRENNLTGNTANVNKTAAQASSGPRRGYIPPEPGRVQPQGFQGQASWQAPAGQPMGQQAGQTPGQPFTWAGYYAGQNPPPPQQPFYNGQSPVNGGQRGFIMPAQTAPRKKEKKKKGHKFLTVFMLLILAAALGTGGYFGVNRYLDQKAINEKVDPYENLFCPGVYVDGISLGGMTPEQAMNSVQSQIRQRHDAWKVQLTYEGKQKAEINSDTLQFNVDPSQVLIEAWNRGHTGDKEERYEDMLLLEQEPYQAYTAKPTGNTGAIDDILTQIKESIDKPAVDAKLKAYNPALLYPFEFDPEEYGLQLDIEPLKEKLYQMASTMESGSLELVPEKLAPSITQGEVMKHYKLRSDVTTPIDRHSTEERNYNIRHAFEFINGYILEPGKTFSFNTVVGERTEERGFLPAIEYVYGEHTEGWGGGVCQASTTLYQAAVKAGLQIVKRRPHSDSVSYAEYGMDATVYWAKAGKKIDFTFRNNTDYPIYILAFVEPDTKNKKRQNARVIMYGEDLGSIRYDMEAVEVEILPCLLQPKYVGSRDSVSEAKDGHVVESYRLMYQNEELVERKLLFKDTYEPKPARIYDPSLAP